MNRRKVLPVAASLLTLFGMLLFATPGAAYVRSRSNGCRAIYWNQSCVYLYPDSALLPDLPNADTIRIIQQAINSWETLLPDAFLKLHYHEPDGPKEVHFDHQSVIKFRSMTWVRPGDCGVVVMPYDHAAAAITTVFFIDKPTDPATDGQILDADIELNAVDNRFYDADQGIPANPDRRTLTDLWNTLTHEMGHLQGLDHTCAIFPDSEGDKVAMCTKDDKGQPRPVCGNVLGSNAPADKIIADTTMFATATPMEKKKRMPKADDIAGIVNAYPLASDPKNCALPQVTDPCGKSGGCAVSAQNRVGRVGPAGLSGLGLLGLVGLLALVISSRSRRWRLGEHR